MRMTLISGKEIDPMNILGGDLVATDIAHALSMICRYGGHVRQFYSVAQHSVNVMRLLERAGCDDPKMLRTALMHDATEAYIGDMVAPLKKHVVQFQEFENDLWCLIARRFNCYVEPCAEVERFDKEIRAWEMSWLCVGCGLPRREAPLLMQKWGPKTARDRMMIEMSRLGVV